MEKLQVEFEVIKSKEIGYGIVEKFLARFGNALPYKAIIKDNKFVAIVGRNYVTIPNEEIEKIAKNIAKNNGYRAEIVYEGPRGSSVDTRIFCYITSKDDGVVITNSIDGGMGLRVYYVYRIGKGYVTYNVREVYKKHTKSIEEIKNELGKICNEVINEGKEKVIPALDALGDKMIADYKEEVKEILEVDKDKKEKRMLPKEYTSHVWNMVTTKRIKTLKEMYEELVNQIWTGKTKITTKIRPLTIV